MGVLDAGSGVIRRAVSSMAVIEVFRSGVPTSRVETTPKGGDDVGEVGHDEGTKERKSEWINSEEGQQEILWRISQGAVGHPIFPE
jgi:hypothetical protein